MRNGAADAEVLREHLRSDLETSEQQTGRDVPFHLWIDERAPVADLQLRLDLQRQGDATFQSPGQEGRGRPLPDDDAVHGGAPVDEPVGFETGDRDRCRHATDAEHIAHGLFPDDEAFGKRTGLDVIAQDGPDDFIQRASSHGAAVGAILFAPFVISRHELLPGSATPSEAQSLSGAAPHSSPPLEPTCGEASGRCTSDIPPWPGPRSEPRSSNRSCMLPHPYQPGGGHSGCSARAEPRGRTLAHRAADRRCSRGVLRG